MYSEGSLDREPVSECKARQGRKRKKQKGEKDQGAVDVGVAAVAGLEEVLMLQAWVTTKEEQNPEDEEMAERGRKICDEDGKVSSTLGRVSFLISLLSSL